MCGSGGVLRVYTSWHLMKGYEDNQNMRPEGRHGVRGLLAGARGRGEKLVAAELTGAIL